MRETGRTGFKARLVRELEHRFPGCMVLSNDPNSLQGVPDLLVLYEDKWAMLEVKAAINSRRRPNQDFYISVFNQMSFAAFVCPENEEEVLNDLQQAFSSIRRPRLSKRKQVPLD